jgi:hypothetical protein
VTKASKFVFFVFVPFSPTWTLEAGPGELQDRLVATHRPAGFTYSYTFHVVWSICFFSCFFSGRVAHHPRDCD